MNGESKLASLAPEWVKLLDARSWRIFCYPPGKLIVMHHLVSNSISTVSLDYGNQPRDLVMQKPFVNDRGYPEKWHREMATTIPNLINSKRSKG